MTHLICVTSCKGGVTKTTTAVNLAAILAKFEYNTLLIDLDAQGHAATALGMDPAPGVFGMFVQEQPLHLFVDATDRPYLSIVRSNQRTKSAVNYLNQAISAGETDRAQLAQILVNVAQDFDYVVIDTPASGILQEIALQAANTVVIPVTLDYLGMDGLNNTMATIGKLTGKRRMIILPAMHEATSEAEHNSKLLCDAYAGCVVRAVPKCTAMREAAANGLTAWEHQDRKSTTLPRVRSAYEHLADLIVMKVEAVQS